MEVARLGPDDSRSAVEAIRVLKTAGVSPAVEYLRTFLSRRENVLIVARSDGRPVGLLLAYVLDRIDDVRTMVCLYEIAVVKEFRRRGVGRAMVERLKELCGCIRATKTWTITNRSNAAALGLFEDTGGMPATDGDDVVLVWAADQWSGGV